MSESAVQAGIHRLRERLASARSQEESDEELLRAFQSRKDSGAFATLLRRHGGMVLGVCRRVLGNSHDAEDAFQATFLVLARDATSLRDKAALSSFLYGIAYRTAMKAKQSAARRRRHEIQTPVRPAGGPSEELLWREVRALLDEEIARLPEINRAAFVLCCLEGVSREEAARRLGLKEGTLSSRLTEARKHLSRRLAQRGVELSAVLGATALGTASARALPARLLTATLEVVTAGAGVSASVARLVKSAAPAALAGKARVVTLLLLAAGILSGAGVWAGRELRVQAARSSAAAPPEGREPQAGPSRREAAKTVQIQGRVLGPDGKPKAGARLLLLGDKEAITDLGVSAEDGRFRVVVPREGETNNLIARAEGAGIDFLDLSGPRLLRTVELRLVKDHPVRGRVVNLEGKPVAGVRVSAQVLNVHINDSLDTFLDAYLKILVGGKGHAVAKQIWSAGPLIAATTDADGRFTLRGMGVERSVVLHLSGGGIADISRQVVNRAGFDPTPYNQSFREHFNVINRRKDQRWVDRCLLYGPDLSFVAEPEKLIRGVVKDADTGKGQAGLKIRLTGYSDDRMPASSPEATTDAAGRYVIHGARKAESYLVQFMGDTATGYTPRGAWAVDTTGYRPVAADLAVKRGVIVTGRVIDRATGKVIPGWAAAAVLSDNPFARDYRFGSFATANGMPFIAHSGELDADGTFRLVTLPGPVLLMGGPDHRKLTPLDALKFTPPATDPQYPKYFQVQPGATTELQLTYAGLQDFRGNVEGNFCKVLNVKPGVAHVKQDIVLERARALKLTIQDAKGRPLSGAWVTGVSPRTRHAAIHLESDTCPVYALEAGRPRLMVFCEPKQKLVGTRTLKGDEKEPLAVKLGPPGALKGRLLDSEGRPLAGVEVGLQYQDSEAEEIEQAAHEGRKQVVTDVAGGFRLEGLMPGLGLRLWFRQDKRALAADRKAAGETLQVEPGACRDLGAFPVTPVKDFKAGRSGK
jgi:RNA polymerase sigma factor (sigma-70 family)